MDPTLGRRRRFLTALLVLVPIGWSSALVAAPYVLAHAERIDTAVRAASVVYLVGAVVCHQQPARSFRVAGVAQPVCARCAGVYAAAPIGVLLGLGFGGRVRARRGHDRIVAARRAILATAGPTLLTLVLEYALRIPVADWVRAVAAVPLAATIGWVVVSGLRGEFGRGELEYTEPANRIEGTSR